MKYADRRKGLQKKAQLGPFAMVIKQMENTGRAV